MCLYAVLRLLRHWNILPELISNYGTDVLFVPAMCLFALIFILYFKGEHSIPFWMVVVQTLLISIYFEWYLPNNCTTPPCYIADLNDVIAYFLGAFLFIVLQKAYLFKDN